MNTDTAPSPVDEALATAERLCVTRPDEALAALARAREGLSLPPAPALPPEDLPQALPLLRLEGLALSHRGRHPEALARLEAALARTGTPPAGVEGVRVLRALAIAWERLGALDESLARARDALQAARALGDEGQAADCLLSIGVACSRAGDHAAGLAEYRAALALHEARSDLTRCVSVLNNIGINLRHLGRLDESAATFTRAVALARDQGDPVRVAILRSNQALTCLAQDRLTEAQTLLHAALPVLSPEGFRGSRAHALVALGRVLARQGDPDAAREALEEVLALCATEALDEHALDAHAELAALHKAAGRWEDALRHHEARHAGERARFDAEASRRLLALQVQHQVHEAQWQAERHRRRHEQIESAHGELQRLHRQLLAADVEKSRLLERLAAQTRTDALTGLANRRHLDERLAEAHALARRQGRRLAVAMADLDFFKRINDRLGHATGDEVLRRVAGLLRAHCRATDLVARYGGEEFCLLFFDVPAATAAAVCAELGARVAAHDWRALHPELVVTMSVGVSDRLDTPTHEGLLADADRHLYEAKHHGKNRVRWAGGERAVAPQASAA